MSRTSDIAFFPCPICKKTPYVKNFNLNYGAAYCKGTLLKRHPLIQVKTEYCNPSQLFGALANEWNRTVIFEETQKMKVERKK